MTETEKIKSPCVKNCCLNDKDICVGCYRSLDEILAWSTSQEKEKLDILKLCEQRKNQS